MLFILFVFLHFYKHCVHQIVSKKNTNYFYAVRISISLAILSEIFI